MSSVLVGLKPVITKISYTCPIATGTNFNLDDSLQKTKGERILWIDLSHAIESNILPGAIPQDPLIYEEEILDLIRQAVVRDMRGYQNKRIDTVRINVDGYEPELEIWQALDGLSPTHLDMRCGWDEECRFLALNDLRHSWKDLDSLSLNNFCCNTFSSSSEVPRVFSQISSLELIYCHQFNFIPPGGATKLARVRIFENNACEMFVMVFEGNPRVAATLEFLEIESKNGCDFQMQYGTEDFRSRLRQCGNLRILHLSMGSKDGMDLDLASHIPPSVEELKLEVTRSFTFLRDMDDWIKHASDVTWLPSLKSFHIGLDTKSTVTDARQLWENESSGSDAPDGPLIRTHKLSSSPELIQSFTEEFETKKKILCELLESTRPPIDIGCLFFGTPSFGIPQM